MKEQRRTNTYIRIIDASLQLFNEHGERNTSTNHIATHLGISPGNLYYHFANKDEIIVQLFQRYSQAVLDYLNTASLPVNVAQAVEYMKGVYEIMWEYRFLFSDVNTLLVRSSELLGQHNDFTRTRVSPLLVKLLTQMQDSGMIAIDERGKQDLAINMWLLTKYWFDFDSSMQGRAKITHAAKKRGIYQTLTLLRPYLQGKHVAEFDEIAVKLSRIAD
ncbi:TetR/AcrR family transcriptional regulator [Conchiformibius kuhniae]|uniref:TetR/AcrR family transcriptional regulator n=1 Tax=Conchiformibius kuhniae TaxID=211502 RepID=A0A8T9MSP5_9NEIS|nr:TetR/AcrR family transcriptional regulator [Conchiformibius kuhniae]UOP04301.1 TetR/AcrR family transcriptional regulator [Conchiformibius kuhniae]